MKVEAHVPHQYQHGGEETSEILFYQQMRISLGLGARGADMAMVSQCDFATDLFGKWHTWQYVFVILL